MANSLMGGVVVYNVNNVCYVCDVELFIILGGVLWSEVQLWGMLLRCGCWYLGIHVAERIRMCGGGGDRKGVWLGIVCFMES